MEMDNQQRRDTVIGGTQSSEATGTERIARKDKKHHLGRAGYIRGQVQRQEREMQKPEVDSRPALPPGVAVAARVASYTVKHLIPRKRAETPAQLPSRLADTRIAHQAVEDRRLRYVKEQGSKAGQQGQAGNSSANK